MDVNGKKFDVVLNDCFADYRTKSFSGMDHLFDPDHAHVFTKLHADHNILVDPNDLAAHQEVYGYIHPRERHRWFGSMRSSQALAQSVFGNLSHYQKMDLLKGLLGDDGKPLFPTDDGTQVELEYKLDIVPAGGRNRLGEEARACTSIDICLDGPWKVFVECKLAEEGVGECGNANKARGCYLKQVGVRYWDYIPDLFDWAPSDDCSDCPIRKTYQLVRNLLAVVQDTNYNIPDSQRCVVLLYDVRNPAFHAGGRGMEAWYETKKHLKRPELLQQCTWQQIMTCLRADASLNWLTQALAEKYGL